MLGGGPTSQHPRNRSQQIRGLLPRAVTSLSSRYPQLLRVFSRFRTEFGKTGALAPLRASRRCAKWQG
jgi:hypothetical protein